MKVTYDKEADAMYIKLTEEKFNKVKIIDKHTIINLDKNGNTFKHIQDTIEMPDYTVQKGNKTEAYKKFDERKLKIVYAGKDKYIKVISVMWR